MAKQFCEAPDEDLREAVSTKITGTGVTEIKYGEGDTRSTPTGAASDICTFNANFLSQGSCTIIVIGKMVIVHVNGISSKSSIDWMIHFKSDYQPYVRERFTYFLGNTKYDGYVTGATEASAQGYVYFSTLNNSDYISATIIFKIV